MILIIRSNAIVSDPRVSKYIDYLDKENLDYHILGWNRKNENIQLKNTSFYQKKSGYNVGGAKAAWDRISWMLFCFRFLCSHKFETVHGCDLDSVFPAIMYKILGHSKTKIIFDVFDWYSDTLAGQPKWILKSFKFMERLSVKYSNSIIICEEEREKQIPYKVSDKLLILPNIPSVADYNFMYKDKSLQFFNKKLTLSYVGGLYGERFLDELLTIASKGLINLLIAGYGDENLEQKCRELNKLDHVRFFGKVTYSEGLHIMYNSDMIYAMYCKTNPNHIFAAPNKFYEGMLLSKAIISTKGTIVGDKIEKLNIGYTIEETITDLEKLVKNVSMDDVKNKSLNAHNLWKEKYKDYVSSFLKKEYHSLIQQQYV